MLLFELQIYNDNIRCVGLVAEVPEHRQKTIDTILALVTTPAIKVFYGVQSRSFEEK